MRPLLSVVTITRNDPGGLARTLESAAGWRGPEVEHLVVAADSGMGVAPPGVRWIERPARGRADAFNEGLRQVEGEWVWFLNGGDAMHEALDPPWFLELLRRTSADIVMGACCFDGEATPRLPPPLRLQWPFVSCWLLHPSTLVRRPLLIRAGGFREDRQIAMDFDLWLRLLRADPRVDVLAVPLTRFDLAGVSERPESALAARRESAAVLLSHAPALAAAGARVAARTGFHLLKAVWRRLR